MFATTLIGQWAHVMKNFVVDNGVWGHVDGSVKPPFDPKKEYYVVALEKWTTENARILTWFHHSVDPSIGMNFSKHKTLKKVGDYLKIIYLESNFTKQYELESSISHVTQQDKSIQEFYNEMTHGINWPLWSPQNCNPMMSMWNTMRNSTLYVSHGSPQPVWASSRGYLAHVSLTYSRWWCSWTDCRGNKVQIFFRCSSSSICLCDFDYFI